MLDFQGIVIVNFNHNHCNKIIRNKNFILPAFMKDFLVIIPVFGFA